MRPCILESEYGQGPVFDSEWPPLCSGVALTFGRYLDSLIERAGWSKAEFARRVKASPQSVSNITNDIRTPPADDVADWADALGLRGVERQRFLDLAAIAHLPPAVRPQFEGILERLERIEKDRRQDSA